MLLIVEGIFIVYGSYLAVLTRNNPALFNESLYIGICIYQVGVLGGTYTRTRAHIHSHTLSVIHVTLYVMTSAHDVVTGICMYVGLTIGLTKGIFTDQYMILVTQSLAMYVITVAVLSCMFVHKFKSANENMANIVYGNQVVAVKIQNEVKTVATDHTAMHPYAQ